MMPKARSQRLGALRTHFQIPPGALGTSMARTRFNSARYSSSFVGL